MAVPTDAAEGVLRQINVVEQVGPIYRFYAINELIGVISLSTLVFDLE